MSPEVTPYNLTFIVLSIYEQNVNNSAEATKKEGKRPKIHSFSLFLFNLHKNRPKKSLKFLRGFFENFLPSDLQFMPLLCIIVGLDVR